MSSRDDGRAGEAAAVAKAAVDALKKFKDLAANPFACLPLDWIGPVGYFAGCKTHLWTSPVSLCVNLKYWQSRGLVTADLKPILRRLCDPEVTARHKKDSDLIADLAVMVSAALNRRKQRAEALKRREADANPAGQAAAVVGVADQWSLPAWFVPTEYPR